MDTNSKSKDDYVSRIGRPFLARRISQLHDILAEQGQEVMNGAGMDLDARLGSVFFLIATRPGLSVAELAQELGLSHQLATYRVKKLVKTGLVSQERDPDDLTRSVLRPTAKADPMVKQLRAVMRKLDGVYAQLFEELGVDLLDLATRAREALTTTSLLERTRNADQ